MAKGWFEPIVPKKKPIDSVRTAARLTAELSTLGSDMLRQCAEYEAPAPDLKVYVRTNTLKRSWSKKGPSQKGGELIVIVASSGNVAPYNVFVRGPRKGRNGRRQARHMAARGWRSVTEIADLLWPKSRRKIIKILSSPR